MHPFNVPLREVQPMAAVGSTPTEDVENFITNQISA